MTPAQYAAELRKHGEAMTLTRPGSASVTVYGKRHQPQGGLPADVAGDRAQSLIRIIISNGEILAEAWPGPPLKDDIITIGANAYVLAADADTRIDSGKIYAHFLTVKG